MSYNKWGWASATKYGRRKHDSDYDSADYNRRDRHHDRDHRRGNRRY